jgi:hypothetical protein
MLYTICLRIAEFETFEKPPIIGRRGVHFGIEIDDALKKCNDRSCFAREE